MGERYWITGVQIGMLKLDVLHKNIKKKIWDDIERKQFIGNFRTIEEQKIFLKKMKEFLKK